MEIQPENGVARFFTTTQKSLAPLLEALQNCERVALVSDDHVLSAIRVGAASSGSEAKYRVVSLDLFDGEHDEIILAQNELTAVVLCAWFGDDGVANYYPLANSVVKGWKTRPIP